MSKRELVLHAFDNKPVPRVPVGFWFHFAEESRFFEGLRDPSVIKTNIAGHRNFYETFQPDFIKLMSDGYFKYPNPMIKNIVTAADLSTIESIGRDHEWIHRQIDLVRQLTGLFGHDVASFYNIFSPSKYLRLLYGIHGVKGDAWLARLMAEDKQAVRHALDVIAQDLGYLAEGVIQQGHADGIYFSVQSIQDRSISPDLYREIIEPSDLQVLAVANQASNYNILHICGYEGSRNDLSRYRHYQAKAINWAVHIEQTDLAAGKKLFGGRAVIGGFDNRAEGLLYAGSQDEIEAATAEILSTAGTTGVILGADCTIPSDIDLKRLEWVRQKAASLSNV